MRRTQHFSTFVGLTVFILFFIMYLPFRDLLMAEEFVFGVMPPLPLSTLLWVWQSLGDFASFLIRRCRCGPVDLFVYD
jgi:hypothetical protein